MRDTMKTGKFYVLLFPFVLLLFFFSMDCVLPSNSSALIGIKEGDAPKEIVLDDINGNSVNVSSHFGKKPVILLFWKLSTNNAFLDYSLDELRLLKNVYEKLHNEHGLEIFAIYTPLEFKDVSDDEILSVRKLIDVNEIKFPVLIDRGFKFFREYGVIALPSTIMIAKTGKIQFIYSSFPMSAHSVISDKIEELVGIAKDTQEDEVVKKKIAETFKPGMHASTFGGGLVVCKAALGVLRGIHKEKMLKNARKMSVYIFDKLVKYKLNKEHTHIFPFFLEHFSPIYMNENYKLLKPYILVSFFL